MKKTTRVFSLLLALALLFVLSACGGAKPSVVGKWETEIDMLGDIIEEMDASVSCSKSFGEYLERFRWNLQLELNEDGSYSLGYDISPDLDHFKSAVVAFMRDAINEQAGGGISDETIAQVLGMSLEDYAQSVCDSMAEAAQPEQSSYRDKNGTLIWEDGAQSPYVLTDDTLSFSVSTLGELTFHRVG